MIRRPADSRLLTNLLSHEKDYSKHLSHLLEHSQASLASFSAYASASTPPLSQVIIAVAGVLVGADDALRKYCASLEGWQGQLKALKDLEDEVGNVMRDREILVTRLIKASKQQKPFRDSVLSTSGSTSSLSFSRLEVPIGPKLSAAQAELQACEAHLAKKERELEHMRVTAIRSGLHARCKAMVECGWTWGEMGKEGLRTLEGVDLPNGRGTHPYSLPPSHSLPNPNSDSGHAASDLSSLSPSQSASQIGIAPIPITHPNVDTSLRSPPVATPPKSYTLQIPPAHSISDNVLPNGKPMPQWRIPEAEEESGGSSEYEEDMRGLEVHENERFAPGRKTEAKAPANPEPQGFSIRPQRESVDSARHVHFPILPSPSVNSSSSGKKERKRNGSMSFFGSIAALFHHKDKDGEAEDERESPVPAIPTMQWSTRTDKYLARARKDGDSSDEDNGARSDYVQQYQTWSSSMPTGQFPQSQRGSLIASQSDHTGSQGLKRRMTKRLKDGAHARAERDRGWVSDDVPAPPVKRQTSGKRKSITAAETSRPKANGNAVAATALSRQASATPRAKPAALPNTSTTAAPDAQAALSRNSSVSKQSVKSKSSAKTLTRSPTSQSPPSSQQPGSPRARSNSLHTIDTPSRTNPSAPIKGHRRANSATSPHRDRSGLTRNNDGPSLMSIVEGVTKQNRAAWARQDPNRMLVMAKAPPPINVDLNFDDVQRPSTNVAEPAKTDGPDRRASPVQDHTHLSTLASSPSLPVSASRSPAKMPLRSALRNSRTPSPNPPLTTGASLSAALEIAAPTPRVASVPTLPYVKPDDDSSSISSYETGHETFYEEAERDPPPPTPPPAGDKPQPAGSDLSQSTGSSVATAANPARRKSVRMSLPPTFSPTPPAFDDDDEENRRRNQPWAPSSNGRDPPSVRQNGWASRIEEDGSRDLWQDSSDSDEEYRVAKRLLARMAKI